jgi:hypothetical protein
MRGLPLLLANTLTFTAVLVANYYYGSGAAGLRTVGEVSALFPTLITPAGYAFAIWGLIYMLLVGFLVYQWITYFNGKENISLQPTGIWFMLSNLFNVAWIFLWVNFAIGWSVVAIIGLLVSLTAMLIEQESYTASSSWRNRIFVHLPIGTYLGWIVLATTLNVSIWIRAAGIFLPSSSPTQWVLPVYFAAIAVYLFLLYQHNRKEPSLVGTWGFLAIAYRQWGEQEYVAWLSLFCGILLAVLALKKQVDSIGR